MKLVVSRGMVLTATGAALGIARAGARQDATDGFTASSRPIQPFAVVIVALLAIALIACWLPTRAAMRVHPAVALRTE